MDKPDKAKAILKVLEERVENARAYVLEAGGDLAATRARIAYLKAEDEDNIGGFGSKFNTELNQLKDVETRQIETHKKYEDTFKRWKEVYDFAVDTFLLMIPEK